MHLQPPWGPSGPTAISLLVFLSLHRGLQRTRLPSFFDPYPSNRVLLEKNKKTTKTTKNSHNRFGSFHLKFRSTTARQWCACQAACPRDPGVCSRSPTRQPPHTTPGSSDFSALRLPGFSSWNLETHLCLNFLLPFPCMGGTGLPPSSQGKAFIRALDSIP